MVTGDPKLSPKILELLSNVVREITVSLTEPLSEFVDILTESLMYPRGTTNSLMNILCKTNEEIEIREAAEFVSQDLGTACLLDAVHTAKLIGKLNVLSKRRDYPLTQSAMLEEVHSALVSLLKQLSGQMETCSHLFFYKDLLRESVVHFRHAFDALQDLDAISVRLVLSARESSAPEHPLLDIDAKTTGYIRTFTVTNANWHEQLLLGSRALKEYLVLHTPSGDDSTNALYEEATVVVRSPVFRNYVQARKSQLKITHRRIF
ncbi:Aro5p LALA0_S13e03752g [Lachancea lanzarotensis]|uniref:LALA0S13e03752g1_1 n=1 Tax=Lachancea lanzarotensis TaxID=1245769 RepID=A0A0C7MXT6_9SACH|nr:uncharacterized protein LALA0_S13e03752g [Lachancea lanzarotensis]CEP64820.1 LALA0S13e03752g1_1 [Lachancea lanzarotensis]